MGDLHDRLGIAACLLDALLSGIDLLSDRVDFPAESSGLEQTSVVKGETDRRGRSYMQLFSGDLQSFQLRDNL